MGTIVIAPNEMGFAGMGNSQNIRCNALRLLAPYISTQVARVDWNGELTIPVILRTALVQNCDVLPIKCTNFLRKIVAG